MTLKEIFLEEELYKLENEKGLSNYKHNLKVVQSEEIKDNEEFQKYLNKTFRELYEEYINSYEFKIVEIKHLREKQMNEDHIEKYINISKNLLNFINQ